MSPLVDGTAGGCSTSDGEFPSPFATASGNVVESSCHDSFAVKERERK